MIGSEERSYRVAGPEAGAPSKIHPRTTARMVCAPMVTKVREGSDCFTKVREVSRKFAQIRPVNPRLFGFIRVGLFFRRLAIFEQIWRSRPEPIPTLTLAITPF